MIAVARKFMTIAAFIFVAAFVLVIWGDRMLIALYKNQGPEAVQRKQQLVAPWFWIIIRDACLAMCVIEMRAGVVKGERLATILRSEHPVWFWGITTGMGWLHW